MFLGTTARVGHALRRAGVLFRIDGTQGVQAVGRSPLTSTQLVVARVDRDPQQPAAQAAGRPVERAQSAKGTEQGVLGGIGSILRVAGERTLGCRCPSQVAT